MKTLIAEFTALPGHEARVAELMAGLTNDVLSNEPGCVQFLPFTREGEPNRWVVFEQYTDDAAFAAHRAAPYGAVFNAELVTHIVEDGSQLTWLEESV